LGKSTSSGLWVPAFAGTTERKKAGEAALGG
jgi:hypothetical protein